MSDEWLIDRLACPLCGGAVDAMVACEGCGDPTLACEECGEQYETEEGIYDFVRSEKQEIDRISDELAGEIDSEGIEAIQQEIQESETDEVRRAQAEIGEAFGERLETLEGATVELATGVEGLAPQLAAKPEVESVATDISIDTLEILRERLGSRTPRAFVACDARNLPFRTGSFDVVVTSGGFNNVAYPSRALDEAARVLDDGRLLSLNLFVDADSATAEKAAEFDVETAYVQSAFERAATQAGFEIETVELSEPATGAATPYDLLPVGDDDVRYGLVELGVANR